MWALDQIHLVSDRSQTFVDSNFTISTANAINPDYFVAAPHGKVETVCGISSLHFVTPSSVTSEAYIDTVPLTLGDNSYIQLQLSTGCLGTPAVSTAFTLFVQYSDNGGSTWSALLPPCNPFSDGCLSSGWAWTAANSIDPSDYANGFTRIVIPLGNQPAGRRFRFMSSSTVTLTRDFALASLYIGNGCGGGVGCGPFGRCVNGTTCVCDMGYKGMPCAPQTPRTTLREFFEDEMPASRWSLLLGGATAQSDCGVLSAMRSLEFRMGGTRLVQTADLDLRGATFIQFVLQLGSRGSASSCRTPNWIGEGLILAYSTNMGGNWTYIGQYGYSSYTTAAKQIVPLPDGAKTSTTRIMLWQPSHSGTSYDVWAIDDFYVGGGDSLGGYASSAAATFLNPLPLSEPEFLFHTGGVRSTFCGKPALVFNSTDGGFELETNVLSIPSSGAVLLFEVATGCGPADTASSDVSFVLQTQPPPEQSVSYRSIHPLGCNPGYDSSCNAWSAPGPSSFAASDFSTGFHRFSIPLEPSLGVRIRLAFLQPGPGYRVTGAIANVYIGNGTLTGCGGRGMFRNGTCECDNGFVVAESGRTCEPATGVRPQELRENFDDELRSSKWLTVFNALQLANGGSCGPLSNALALRFDGPGVRRLESADLNTTSARFIQYLIQLGSISGSSDCRTPFYNEGVALAFSTDFGLHYTVLEKVLILTTPSWRTIDLPAAAQSPHTRFMWWQPVHSGIKGNDVWVLEVGF